MREIIKFFYFGILTLVVLYRFQDVDCSAPQMVFLNPTIGAATDKMMNAIQKYINDPSSTNFVNEFSSDLAKSVLKLTKNIPISQISDTINTELPIASEALNLPDEINDCTIDYSPMCPEDWIDVGNGKDCIAPEKYTGECDKKLDLSNSTPLNKRLLALKCNFNWKCIDMCEENFDYQCPTAWEYKGNTCRASSDYLGECVLEKNFENFDEVMKKQWGKKCGVKWPCNKPDYNFKLKHCPIDWVQIDNKTCQAPSYYIGPCDFKIPMGELSENEKRNISHICKLQWPSDQKFDYDFSAACPIGWTLDPTDKNYCIAKNEYTGPCEKRVLFEGIDKYEWAIKCNASWKIKDEIERNFSGCPMGWELIDENNYICQAPSHYNGKCPSIYSFKNYNKDMKLAWGKACDVAFTPNILSKIKEQSQKNSLNNFSEKTVKRYLNSNGVHDLSLPNFDILEPNGTIYYPSGSKKINYSEPMQASNKLANYIASGHHINVLEKLKSNESNRLIKSAMENAIGQLEAQGGNTSIDFSFLQKTGMIDTINSMDQSQYDMFQTNEIESYENDDEEITKCQKNYLKCPIGWQTLKNLTCLAPQGYIKNGGKCKDVLDISMFILDDFYPKNIQKWKKLCEVEFPCISEGQENFYNIICPAGWRHIGNGNCAASNDYPEHYRDRCGTLVNFNFASPEYKKSWSKICGATWPYFSSCVNDYSDPCPNGYYQGNDPEIDNSKGIVCHPHIENNNICGNPLIFQDNYESKNNIHKNCGLPWPCVETCKMDFWQMCPIGWTYKRTSCYPPDDYIPRKWCKKSIFVGGTLLQMPNFYLKKLAKVCNLAWPCKGTCQQDWSDSCPYNWKLNTNSDKIICKASKKYNGPCQTKADLTGFTFAMKQEFAFRCQVKWRCGGTKKSNGISYRTNKGWQKKKVFEDTNWEDLKTLQFLA